LSGIEIQSLAGDLHSGDWNSVAVYGIYTSGIDSTEFHSLAVIFIPGDWNWRLSILWRAVSLWKAKGKGGEKEKDKGMASRGTALPQKALPLIQHQVFACSHCSGRKGWRLLFFSDLVKLIMNALSFPVQRCAFPPGIRFAIE
jgi:hypothetical protein